MKSTNSSPRVRQDSAATSVRGGGRPTAVAIAAAIAETGAEGLRDMGRVMAALKGKYTGQMDFGSVGPMGKCAQFPLHLWRDEAMEGPLPSTILRNSVVVSVGAWVLIKLTPVLALSPVGQWVAIALGGLTAIGAALISAAQVDIKRVVSYLSSS